MRAAPEFGSAKLILLRPRPRREGAGADELAGVDALLTRPVRKSKLFACLRDLTENSAAPGDNDAALVSGESTPPDAAAVKPGTKVLVAEDNPVNQKVVLRMLSKLGYQAHAVVNGAEALRALTEQPYDLVLMDCQMPVMDGYQAAAEIRNLEGSLRGIPIIALTANAMQGDREKCIEAGMDDYLSKPIDRSTLAAMLDYWAKVARGETPVRRK